MRNSAPLKARLLLLFLVLMAIFISVEAKIECRYTTGSCGETGLTETLVLRISDMENAHAAEPDSSATSYPGKICCTDITRAGPCGPSSKNQNIYVSLSDNGLDNAHAAFVPNPNGIFNI